MLQELRVREPCRVALLRELQRVGATVVAIDIPGSRGKGTKRAASGLWQRLTETAKASPGAIVHDSPHPYPDEAELREAENDLAGAMKRLDKCNAHLAGLKEQFEAQMAEKTRVEEGARALERRPTARCTAYEKAS